MIINDENDSVFLSDDSSFGLYINHKSMKKMLQICTAAKKVEVGGIIVGKYDEEQKYALVKHVSNVPSDSLSTPNFFRRGIQGLQNALNKYWYQRQYYLGEWHFHPNASAKASSVDIEQMILISQSSAYNCPEPVLIIVGGDPTKKWEMKSYVFPRNRKWMELKNR